MWARALAVAACIVLLIGLIQYGAEQLKLQMARVRGEVPEKRLEPWSPPSWLGQAMVLAGFAAAIPLIAWRIHRDRSRIYGIIRVEDLQKHLLIYGPTGSGKTSTALKAVELSLKSGVDVIVIDWKGEYVDKIRGAMVIRKLKLLELPDWDDVENHVLVVVDILRDVLELTEPMAFALYEELSRMYEKHVASFSRLLELVKARRGAMLAARNYAEARIAEGLIRRLLPLVLDEGRRVANRKGSERVVVYDLSKLQTYQLKTLYAEMILWRIYCEAVKSGSRGLRKLIICEEAQNYVRPRRPERPPGIGERIVNELRTYGYGAVLISPDPSQIPYHMARDAGAVISIGYQALPDVILDLLRFADVKKPARAMSRPRTYIYHDGRLHVRRLPRPYLKTINLRVEAIGEKPEPSSGAIHSEPCPRVSG